MTARRPTVAVDERISMGQGTIGSSIKGMREKRKPFRDALPDDVLTRIGT